MQKSKVARILGEIRTQSPLVHNITNYVVMNSTANALLAVGASPIMAHAIEEMEDMVAISSVLVINIGTLSKNWIDAMVVAGKLAKAKGIPVVFDPVGAGASKFRTDTCMRIIRECSPDIIRGNASEIMALVDSSVQTKGVDSNNSSNDAIENATLLSKALNNTVVISGQTDYIISGDNLYEIHNGNEMMSHVTGMGCTATAIVGAFAAVEKDYFLASIAAMAVMGVAGELTANVAVGPGSFQMNFLDRLYSISKEDIMKNIRFNPHG